MTAFSLGGDGGGGGGLGLVTGVTAAGGGILRGANGDGGVFMEDNVSATDAGRTLSLGGAAAGRRTTAGIIVLVFFLLPTALYSSTSTPVSGDNNFLRIRPTTRDHGRVSNGKLARSVAYRYPSRPPNPPPLPTDGSIT